ncbi:hypothetical protein FDECE_12112 [Fusarium decemcellulare]|nr:hypothetical protein FDECE_12112 [Fusarium decemcellulare]
MSFPITNDPSQSPDVAHQAYEPSGNHLVLDDSALQAQATNPQLTTDQSHFLHPFNPSQAPRIDAPNNAEPLGHAETLSPTSTGPPSAPTKSRRRKAPTRRAKDWKPYKDQTIELYKKLPLAKVMDIIEKDSGFAPSKRQFQTRISQWGGDKNIKPVEMKAIVRKQQQRKLVEVDKGELSFTVRGSNVGQKKIDRWMKRHEVSESRLYAPSPAASTPSAVSCHTISELGSPPPSPAFSVSSPNVSPTGIMSVVQSPTPSSPTLSVWSIALRQNNTFVGHSPAPTYRPLPTLLSGSPPTSNAFVQDQLDAEVGSLQYRYEQADEERLREELSMAETMLGTSHSQTLDILFELGVVLINQGRYKSAEKVVRRLVEGCRDMNGNNGLEMIDALELLGQVLSHQRLDVQAWELRRRIFESRKIKLGETHPKTLTSMANLAETYGDLGRWKKAEALQEKVMASRKAALGEEHHGTLKIMTSLAETYLEQGRWNEAEDLQVLVMGIRKRVSGEEHPATLCVTAGLASTYLNQGRWDEAEDLGVSVLETRKRIFGEEHPYTLTSMSHLAMTYRFQGRWKEAEDLQMKDFHISSRIYGDEHPETLHSMAGLVLIHQSQGRWNEAEELGVRVVEMSRRVLGEEHPNTLQSIEDLTSIRRNQGTWN